MVTSGLVVRSYSGYYYVDCDGTMITCKVKGHMKQKRFSLCTGDRVELELNPDKPEEGMITSVLPRRNYLERPTVANLDLLVITLALVRPDFSFLIADKLLVLAEAAKIPVLLVLTKADLATEEQSDTIADLYRNIGCETFVISSRTGQGIAGLRQRLEGKVTAFGGPSGVGKSSALNAIQPGVLRATGEISSKISRGKHTTRYTELIPFNGGYLADTPGFGNVLMETLEPEALPACFPEFRQFEVNCKFSPCSHTHEPVCGVKDAVKENIIALSRYESYLSILKEVKENKARNRR
ncbi:MAG: ribosome small subunit-dependent GTPase A [Acidaminococcaceae bacterium]|nr:ribosome small subunit-dependent GTPase A [Acidaminococcaceae bacterium]